MSQEFVILWGETSDPFPHTKSIRLLVHLDELKDNRPEDFFPWGTVNISEQGRVQVLGDVDWMEPVYNGEMI